MFVYPQLSTGALVQFPVYKVRRPRTIENALADMSSIKYADPDGEFTDWQVEYSGLSDDEASALADFFAMTEGYLQTFCFLDPTANLFAWSDQLSNAVWNKGPFLGLECAIADPMGGTNAWRLTNTGAGPQTISQTLSVPGGYQYCLSVYSRAAQPGVVSFLRGNDQVERVLCTEWSRITFSGSGDPTAETVEFGIELPAGECVDVFGLQVEPQPNASAYKSSTTGGVYANAYFRDDTLAFTATGLNRHSVTVNIRHAKRL
ncbi:MAG: hypothetical protein C5B51_17210 [Terriglobia bacterium]|nr:MAG: hypothetical protein C5B51_17210 [Terriglobia bacterium]